MEPVEKKRKRIDWRETPLAFKSLQMDMDMTHWILTHLDTIFPVPEEGCPLTHEDVLLEALFTIFHKALMSRTFVGVRDDMKMCAYWDQEDKIRTVPIKKFVMDLTQYIAHHFRQILEKLVAEGVDETHILSMGFMVIKINLLQDNKLFVVPVGLKDVQGTLKRLSNLVNLPGVENNKKTIEITRIPWKERVYLSMIKYIYMNVDVLEKEDVKITPWGEMEDRVNTMSLDAVKSLRGRIQDTLMRDYRRSGILKKQLEYLVNMY